MSNDSADKSLGEKLKDVGDAVTALTPKFGNLGRMRNRILGDVGDALFDALKARIQRYQVENEAKTIQTIIRETGLPPSHVYESLRRQKNLDMIAASTLSLLHNNNEQSRADPPNDSITTDDFFDVFRREAADRSTEEMRERFARILAGEMQQPGSFSVQTLRVLGTISTKTAEGFRKAASISMFFDDSLGAIVPSAGGNLGMNDLSYMGLSFLVFQELIEAGLLRSDFDSQFTFTSKPFSEPNVRPCHSVAVSYYQGEDWALIPSTEDLSEGQQLKVGGIIVTRVGRELLKVVDIEPMPEFTERLKQHFDGLRYRLVPVRDLAITYARGHRFFVTEEVDFLIPEANRP